MNSPAKTLRLTWWHLGLWLSLALVAGGIAVRACLRYNEVAGTDKSPVHIAVIAAAVVTSPLVGPVANPSASSIRPSTWLLTALLGGGMLGGLAPFLMWKRPVSTLAYGLAWAAVRRGFGGLVSGRTGVAGNSPELSPNSEVENAGRVGQATGARRSRRSKLGRKSAAGRFLTPARSCGLKAALLGPTGDEQSSFL